MSELPPYQPGQRARQKKDCLISISYDMISKPLKIMNNVEKDHKSPHLLMFLQGSQMGFQWNQGLGRLDQGQKAFKRRLFVYVCYFSQARMGFTARRAIRQLTGSVKRVIRGLSKSIALGGCTPCRGDIYNAERNPGTRRWCGKKGPGERRGLPWPGCQIKRM